jgi:hypothetical protein
MSQRKGRNSIPPVNPNPRPPNEPKYGLANNQPAGSRVGVGQNKPVYKQQAGIGGGKALGGKSGGVPTATAPSPASGSFAAPVDPRDSQYWRDMAQLNYNKEVANMRFNTSEQFDKSQYERDVANRNYLDPIEVQRNRESANVGGTIYSTSHQEDLGNLAQQQFQTRAGMSEAYQRAIAERANDKWANEQGYELGNQGAYGEATERAARAESERPGPYVEPPNYASAQQQAKKNRAKGKKKK